MSLVLSIVVSCSSKAFNRRQEILENIKEKVNSESVTFVSGTFVDSRLCLEFIWKPDTPSKNEFPKQLLTEVVGEEHCSIVECRQSPCPEDPYECNRPWRVVSNKELKLWTQDEPDINGRLKVYVEEELLNECSDCFVKGNFCFDYATDDEDETGDIVMKYQWGCGDFGIHVSRGRTIVDQEGKQHRVYLY
jgi:hypothetical protein